MSFRNISTDLPQRLSCLLFFQWLSRADAAHDLRPRAPRPDRCTMIYDNLQCPVEFGTPAAADRPRHAHREGRLRRRLCLHPRRRTRRRHGPTDPPRQARNHRTLARRSGLRRAPARRPRHARRSPTSSKPPASASSASPPASRSAATTCSGWPTSSNRSSATRSKPPTPSPPNSSTTPSPNKNACSRRYNPSSPQHVSRDGASGERA